MLSVFDQENLATTRQTTAASKPLNQGIRALQPKTPGQLKSSFKTQTNENNPVNTGKIIKTSFATPSQPTIRAPLGAKTTNVKANAFQTPAPIKNQNKNDGITTKKSSIKRSAKRKIHVEPEPAAPFVQLQNKPDEQEVEDDDEPDFGYAPPSAEPLPDPPIDFSEIDQTYPMLKPENFNRGVGELYFQSPKDETGFSLSLKRQEEVDKQSLQDDLDNILLGAGVSARPESETTKAKVRAQPSQVGTIKARSAASALSQSSQARAHQRLPSAATKETAASKQKRKPAFAVAHDNGPMRNLPLPASKATIGFPKARKPPSILPTSERSRQQPEPKLQHLDLLDTNSNDVAQYKVSPRRFVELHGEPPVESDMWFKLMELEIRDRHRQDQVTPSGQEEPSIFELDDDLDDRLAMDLDQEHDFELEVDEY